MASPDRAVRHNMGVCNYLEIEANSEASVLEAARSLGYDIGAMPELRFR